MRASLASFVVLSIVACGPPKGGDVDGGDDDPGQDACVGLECQIADCAKDGKPPTTLTGVVHAPNGTLPLYGVYVYVPRDPVPLAAFPEGAQCGRCSDGLPGTPIVRTQTDESGQFRLEGVPSGSDIPLVITTGKWRRQFKVPVVDSCGEVKVPAAETRLPKTKAEGDIPKIALTTGDQDSLECLVKRLGIDDSEVTIDGGSGRVHFFRGDGLSSFSNGGGTLTDANTLWSSEAKLKQYDIVFLACEGQQRTTMNANLMGTMNAIKAYADAGGRVFATHWHNTWIGGAFISVGGTTYPRPPVWSTLATWRSNGDPGDPGNPIIIDESPSSNPKGASFATWMLNVKGTGPTSETMVSPDTTRGQIALKPNDGRVSALSLPDMTKVERWVYSQGQMTPQMFQFSTPQEEPQAANRCGKVVFTDMHVGGMPLGGGYPLSCPSTDLTPQEKALAFMFFDIASCVGPIF